MVMVVVVILLVMMVTLTLQLSMTQLSAVVPLLDSKFVASNPW